MVLAGHEADAILSAWGAFQRAQFEAEVGYPGVCPSCVEYEAPEWNRPPPGPIRPGDIDRACWSMIIMLNRHQKLHQDLTRHYRDGEKIGYGRKAEGWSIFGRIWAEWAEVDQPLNPL